MSNEEEEEEEEEVRCEFSGEGVRIPTEGGCLPARVILARQLCFKPPTNIEPGTAWLPNGYCEINTSVCYISVYYTLVHSTSVCGIS